ncbi:MAG: hypothetical protein Q8O41_03740 [Candidatus Methanoperedens sp.]|nr:hypothetical protein [Candidatus Methanoperedens sp.]
MVTCLGFDGGRFSMGKMVLEDYELDILFGKEKYERKKGKIFVYKSTDIYSRGYHKWLRQDNKVLRTGNKLCESGRPSLINEISVLRAKIENIIF